MTRGHGTAVYWLLTWMIVGCLPAVARAARAERILLFDSHIQIAADGVLTVREMIRIHAAGKTIRHGIYRDFPTLYHTAGGFRRSVPLTVKEVLQNGKPQTYALEEIDNGVRIRIGRRDRLLEPGDYTYTIVYTTARQLRFFGDHDELYWNVTGNGWQWPIERAGAQVTLPKQAPADQMRLTAYTGPAGARGKDCAWTINPQSEALFHTTGPLKAHEGLTIVVRLPKGIVQPPGAARQWRDWSADNADWLAGVLGLAAVLLYFLWAWFAVGRGPPRGTIGLRFEPPQGLSPAGARYLWRMGFDDTCLAAALIDLAVQGGCTIEQAEETHFWGSSPGKYILKRMREGEDPPKLGRAESAAAEALFAEGSELTLDRSQQSRLQSGLSALQKELARKFEGKYFNTHLASLVWGVLMAIVTMAAMALLQPQANHRWLTGFFMVWLSIWSVGVAAMLGQFLQSLGRGGMKWIGPGLATLFFGGFAVAGLWLLSTMTSVWIALLLAALLISIVCFQKLLKAPTLLGRQVLDELAGFRQYLAQAPAPVPSPAPASTSAPSPERTPQLFERFLPYALALGVERQWAGQFADQLSSAAARQSYAPLWYHGSAWHTLGAAGFADSLTGSFCTAVSSASTSGASGSSGGGGGGGGGGGW